MTSRLVRFYRMSSPISAAEQTRSARLGGLLFRNRSWLPVLFIGVPLLVPGHMNGVNWFMGALVILVGECCDPYSVEAVRATMGSVFAVPIAKATQAEFLAWRSSWLATGAA